MNNECSSCQKPFQVTKSDLEFYKEVGPTVGGKKFPIPAPELCPACRMQRRIAFRNFFNLHHRTCDLSGKRIISMYDEQVKFPVYEMHEWWSDKWDSLEYGTEIDLSKSVFEHIKILHTTVPRMSILNSQCENTDYCNFSFLSKNSYLIGGNVRNEDCAYGHIVWKSIDCYDNLYIYQCERCYECVDCFDCYDLAYSRACENCSSSRFLVHCAGCKDCFGCVGLKSKQYCIFNEQLTKEEYASRMSQFNQGSYSIIAMVEKKVQELIGSEIVKYYHGLNCEDVSGDYLYNCKNVWSSFDAKNCEDCKYLATAESFVHSHDSNYSPSHTEWSYQLVACDGNSLICCHNCLSSTSELLYCQDCFSCKNCFGCQSLKGKQYCIFNKQYTKDEYEVLVPRLIQSMTQDGTWGVFYPMEFSPFGYNQTMAHEYFPLSKQDAIKQGFSWSNEQDKQDTYMGPVYTIPDDIAEVSDNICEQILLCKATQKPYKVIPQELKFLKDVNLPIPRFSFIERHKKRMILRNPRQLWNRTCAKCSKEIQTTYAPDRPETVYCEECYLNSIA